MNEFCVIDHDKTFVSTTDFSANIAAAAGPDGDFVYRFGSPTNYNQGDRLPPGRQTALPRSGGRTTFNGSRRPCTRAGPPCPGPGTCLFSTTTAPTPTQSSGGSELKEINPYVTGPAVNGVYPVAATYQNPPVAGYARLNSLSEGMAPVNPSNQVVWRFRPKWNTSFASSHISGVQRLPNGGGTAASATDEWIELYNSTGSVY